MHTAGAAHLRRPQCLANAKDRGHTGGGGVATATLAGTAVGTTLAATAIAAAAKATANAFAVISQRIPHAQSTARRRPRWILSVTRSACMRRRRRGIGLKGHGQVRLWPPRRASFTR